MGADVIKIEQPGGRRSVPRLQGRPLQPAFPDLQPQQAQRHAQHQGARRISPLFDRLVADADIFIQNFRPGVAERLKVDAARLQALNPRLIYCSISGFGPSGPGRDRPAFDTVAQAASGFLRLLVNPGESARGRAGHRRCHDRLLRRLRCARRAARARRGPARGGWSKCRCWRRCATSISTISPIISRPDEVMGPYSRPHVSQSYVFQCATAAGSRCTCPRRPNSGKALAEAVDQPDMLQRPEFADRQARIANYEAVVALPGADLRVRNRAPSGLIGCSRTRCPIRRSIPRTKWSRSDQASHLAA